MSEAGQWVLVCERTQAEMEPDAPEKYWGQEGWNAGTCPRCKAYHSGLWRWRPAAPSTPPQPSAARPSGDGHREPARQAARPAPPPPPSPPTPTAAPEPSPGPAPGRAKTSWTLAELLAAQFAEPRWIVPGLLPVGLAHLSGRPKLGKSWMALQLAVAVCAGGYFLGRKVEAGGILYIALEDSPRRLQDRLRKLNASPTHRVRFETDWPPLDLKDEEGHRPGLTALATAAYSGQVRLIVIDTLARAFGKRDWNDVADATNALADLQRLALEAEVAILCLDHHRKNSGTLADPIDDILGSTGKAAVVDTVWGLYRKRGERGATLRVTGRDVEDLELALEFDVGTFCWQCMGDTREVARTQAQNEVLAVLAQFGEEGADAQTVAEATERSRQAARDILERLVDDGKALRKEVCIPGGGRKVIYVASAIVRV